MTDNQSETSICASGDKDLLLLSPLSPDACNRRRISKPSITIQYSHAHSRGSNREGDGGMRILRTLRESKPPVRQSWALDFLPLPLQSKYPAFEYFKPCGGERAAHWRRLAFSPASPLAVRGRLATHILKPAWCFNTAVNNQRVGSDVFFCPRRLSPAFRAPEG